MAPQGCATKSNLILGMGEERDEVLQTMADLRSVGVELLTITQYLQPSRAHLNLQRFVPPRSSPSSRPTPRSLGFAHVESGALVRSSYHAGEMHKAAVRKQRGHLPAWASTDASL